MGWTVPNLDRFVAGSTQAMSLILMACAVTVLAFGSLMRPVLQWETRVLDRLTEGDNSDHPR
jgi:hypothetical protein